MKSVFDEEKEECDLNGKNEQIPQQRTQPLKEREELFRVEITQEKQEQAKGQRKKRRDCDGERARKIIKSLRRANPKIHPTNN